MSLTSDFKDSPETFLAKYIVIVSEPNLTETQKTSGIVNLVFSAGVGTTVTLKKPLVATTDCVKAYWLPWKTLDITTMDLGKDADYFFTSQMSNCRFSVLTNEKNPKVAHLAGTWSRTKRNEAEDKWIEGKTGKKEARARRLSIADADTHGYGGQDSAEEKRSIAFVYGIRNVDTGIWTLKAQIVKGDYKKLSTADVKDLKILTPFAF